MNQQYFKFAHIRFVKNLYDRGWRTFCTFLVWGKSHLQLKINRPISNRSKKAIFSEYHSPLLPLTLAEVADDDSSGQKMPLNSPPSSPERGLPCLTTTCDKQGEGGETGEHLSNCPCAPWIVILLSCTNFRVWESERLVPVTVWLFYLSIGFFQCLIRPWGRKCSSKFWIANIMSLLRATKIDSRMRLKACTGKEALKGLK